jgi:hypothetical protein
VAPLGSTCPSDVASASASLNDLYAPGSSGITFHLTPTGVEGTGRSLTTRGDGVAGVRWRRQSPGSERCYRCDDLHLRRTVDHSHNPLCCIASVRRRCRSSARR